MLQDMKLVLEHPTKEEEFVGMELFGCHYTEKKDAASMLLAARDKSETIDKKKFYFDTKKKTKGQMVTGWLTIGKKKYYLSPKTKTLGQIVTGTLKIRKKTYKFNKSGVCLNP